MRSTRAPRVARWMDCYRGPSSGRYGASKSPVKSRAISCSRWATASSSAASTPSSTRCLLPDYRGKGIRKASIARVEDGARSLGVRALHLEVATDKPQAIVRYRRWGFKEHDGLLMTKLL